jgi:tRNA (guanine26-N2/guanine27-N2)-dimethyltransferase
LALITGETEAPVTYYVVDKLCDALTLPVPPVKKIVNALEKEGFPAFLTHFNPKGVKSNVPAMKIKEILREMLSTN